MEKADDEMLEVEVFPNYFRIRGSYSVVIYKVRHSGQLFGD